MKALALESFEGGPKVIDVPDPVAGPGEVLVRVGAASVNAFDVAVAAGYMKDFMPCEFSAVIGSDLAGRVEAVGEDVEDFEVGAPVFGMMGMKGAIHDGSLGEFTNPTAASIERLDPERLPTDLILVTVKFIDRKQAGRMQPDLHLPEPRRRRRRT